MSVKSRKIKIRCPDCDKSEIFEISKDKPVHWQHECDLHYYFVDIEVSEVSEE